jgi:hypothetical protein
MPTSVERPRLQRAQRLRRTRAALVAVGSVLTLARAAAAGGEQPLPRSDAANVQAQSRVAKLELGLDAGAAHRPSSDDAVSYQPGIWWSGHATVVLLENLGVRLTGGMEYHAIDIEQGTLASGPVEGQPRMSGPHVKGQLQPMLRLTPRFDIFALLGVGWQRFTANAIGIGEPSPLLVSRRSGVLVELPLAIGARYAVLRERMAVGLSFCFTAPMTQTGALFDSNAGTNQSLRQDTGELVRVGGLPHFESALSAGLSFDFFF